MTASGTREVIILKWSPRGGPWSDWADVFIRGNSGALSAHVKREGHVRPWWRVATHEPGRRQHAPEIKLALASWSWTSRLQNCEKIYFCNSSCPVCGILLWLPEQTNTTGKECDSESCDQRYSHILRYEEVIMTYSWVNFNFMLTKTACLWPVKHTPDICLNY